MRKSARILSLVFLAATIAISVQSCKVSTAENSTNTNSTTVENQPWGEVTAYYFHATRRCATCQAVETVSKETITEFYGDKVTFESINREEEKDNPLIAKYKISGQTLLIVKGDKVVNLTNDAFLNARTNPDKFKSRLKSTIDSML